VAAPFPATLFEAVTRLQAGLQTRYATRRQYNFNGNDGVPGITACPSMAIRKIIFGAPFLPKIHELMAQISGEALSSPHVSI
jgi:hypothetical protein